MQPSPARRGKVRAGILYWFRTPPNIKLGREPFADHVRRGLEAQNPGVRFDWDAIVATPIPPPDAEHWRERRRAERAAKQAAKAEAAAVVEEEAAERAGGVGGVEEAGGVEEVEEGREPLAVSAPEVSESVPSTQELQTTPDTLSRRRRRRRGRRRPQRPGNEAAPAVAPSVAPAVGKPEG